MRIARGGSVLQRVLVGPNRVRVISTPRSIVSHSNAVIATKRRVVPNLITRSLHCMRCIRAPRNPTVLLHPIRRCAIPGRPSMPDRSSTTSTTDSVGLQTIRQMPFGSKRQIGSISDIRLLQARLILSVRSRSPRIITSVRLIPSRGSPSLVQLRVIILRARMVHHSIITSRARNDAAAALLIGSNSRVTPKTMLTHARVGYGRSKIIHNVHRNRRTMHHLLIIHSSSRIRVSLTKGAPSIGIKSLIITRASLTPNVDCPRSNRITHVRSSRLALQLTHPCQISANTILRVRSNSLIRQNSGLILLIFRQTGANSVVRNLPQVRRLLRTHGPGRTYVLTHHPNATRIICDSSRAIRIGIVRRSNIISRCPVGPNRGIVISSNRRILANTRLASNPTGPRRVLRMFFRCRVDLKINARRTTLGDLGRMRDFLIGRIRSICRSRNVSVSSGRARIVIQRVSSGYHVSSNKSAAVLPNRLIRVCRIRRIGRTVSVANNTPTRCAPILLKVAGTSLGASDFVSTTDFRRAAQILARTTVRKGSS